MPREHEAVILSIDTILKALRNTLPDEKIDKQEVKILQEKDERRAYANIRSINRI